MGHYLGLGYCWPSCIGCSIIINIHLQHHPRDWGAAGYIEGSLDYNNIPTLGLPSPPVAGPTN